jgi:hypothetical protein
VVTLGAGFLPNWPVTFGITYFGEDIVDYLNYISDAHGCMSAAPPETAIIETLQLAVTDRRPDPAGDGGLLWSNTVIVSPIGT